jgi:hypothetical protein
VGFFIAGALLFMVGAKIGIPLAARGSWEPGALAPLLVLLVGVALLVALVIYQRGFGN